MGFVLMDDKGLVVLFFGYEGGYVSDESMKTVLDSYPTAKLVGFSGRNSRVLIIKHSFKPVGESVALREFMVDAERILGDKNDGCGGVRCR